MRKQFFGQQQQVVEVDRANALEIVLIAAISGRGQLLAFACSNLSRLGRTHRRRLPTADDRQQVARRKRRIRSPQLAQCRARLALLLIAIADRKLLRIAKLLDMPPKNPHAKRVKRRNLRPRRRIFCRFLEFRRRPALAGQQCAGPLLHLAGRFLRERDGQDPLGLRPAANQLGDAIRNNARFARSGTRPAPAAAPSESSQHPVEEHSDRQTSEIHFTNRRRRKCRRPKQTREVDIASPSPTSPLVHDIYKPTGTPRNSLAALDDYLPTLLNFRNSAQNPRSIEKRRRR